MNYQQQISGQCKPRTPEVALGTAVPALQCEVVFIGELAALLRCSRRTIERRLKAGTFPVRPLPSIDCRRRWLRREVERCLSRPEGRR